MSYACAGSSRNSPAWWLQAYLLERAGDTTAALQLLCGQLQAAAQALLAGILAGLVPVEQLQPSLHFRAFMQVLLCNFRLCQRSFLISLLAVQQTAADCICIHACMLLGYNVAGRCGMHEIQDNASRHRSGLGGGGHHAQHEWPCDRQLHGEYLTAMIPASITAADTLQILLGMCLALSPPPCLRCPDSCTNARSHPPAGCTGTGGGRPEPEAFGQPESAAAAGAGHGSHAGSSGGLPGSVPAPQPAGCPRQGPRALLCGAAAACGGELRHVLSCTLRAQSRGLGTADWPSDPAAV